MIQRQQSLWLLLATIAAILCFVFPFATGKDLLKGVETDHVLKAGTNFLLLLSVGASIILSTINIFLYKDRPLQARLCLLGIILTVLIIIQYIFLVGKMTKSTLALFCVLPFIMAISYYIAYRDIKKDEKLVKSLDKLR
jgi:hypothetical protein